MIRTRPPAGEVRLGSFLCPAALPFQGQPHQRPAVARAFYRRFSPARLFLFCVLCYNGACAAAGCLRPPKTICRGPERMRHAERYSQFSLLARPLHRGAVFRPQSGAAAGGVCHRGPAADFGGRGQRQDHRAGQPHREPHPVRLRPRLGRAAPRPHRRGGRRPRRGGGATRPPVRRGRGAAAGAAGAALEYPRHHLYQQGRGRIKGPAGPDAGRDGGRGCQRLHLPLGLRAHSAPQCRPARLPPELYHLRHRRPASRHERGV